MNKITHKITIRKTGEDSYYFCYSIVMEFATHTKVKPVLEYHALTYSRARDLSFTIQASVTSKNCELAQ
jgi:hypothetical protein